MASGLAAGDYARLWRLPGVCAYHGLRVALTESKWPQREKQAAGQVRVSAVMGFCSWTG